MECVISSAESSNGPYISIAIATYNAAKFVEAAIRSALTQSIYDVEVIVVDDCSTDDTLTIVERLARADARVRVEQLPENRGPAAARNRALASARGRWFAVLDSDDLFLPERSERLIAAAEQQGADIIADNPVVFYHADEAAPHLFLPTPQLPRWLTLEDYLAETRLFERGTGYGYLKPIVRMDRLRRSGLQYDESLRIAEDDDLIVRMLIHGLSYWIDPLPTYGYRKHKESISHRLSVTNAAAMTAASAVLISGTLRHPAHEALKRRHAAFKRALAFVRLIAALKELDAVNAARIVLARPTVVPLLRMPLAAAFARRFPEKRLDTCSTTNSADVDAVQRMVTAASLG